MDVGLCYGAVVEGGVLFGKRLIDAVCGLYRLPVEQVLVGDGEAVSWA